MNVVGTLKNASFRLKLLSRPKFACLAILSFRGPGLLRHGNGTSTRVNCIQSIFRGTCTSKDHTALTL